jgi:glycosyltransferase involved in cell wall biosynthesis
MNSNKALVSIVMCVYNGADFLGEQLESILSQTYSNFELLILNDRSTDSSKDIIQQYMQKDSRIKYFENDVNLGFNKNFEKGFSLCSGDLIAVSDQDDIWIKEKIEELLNELGENLLIYSNSALIDESGHSLNKTLDYDVSHVDNPTFKSFLDGNFITGHTCLFKKTLLAHALPFPDNVYSYDWWLGFTASYTGRVKYLHKILTLYRIHGESVIQKLDSHHDRKAIKGRKKYLLLLDFANASFLKADDRVFIQKLLDKKFPKKRGLVSFISCYRFLLKHHLHIYPWYKKSDFKKLNFIRKQCLKA